MFDRVLDFDWRVTEGGVFGGPGPRKGLMWHCLYVYSMSSFVFLLMNIHYVRANEAESSKTVFAPSVCARNEAPLINDAIVLHAVSQCCGQRFSISRSVS